MDEDFIEEEDFTTETLSKMAQCAQMGKVLDLDTMECVDAWPPSGYTPPPGTTPPGYTPPGGIPGTVPGTVPTSLPGWVSQQEHERQLELARKSATAWKWAAVGTGVGGAIVGGLLIAALRRR